jgi:hypothetical protein
MEDEMSDTRDVRDKFLSVRLTTDEYDRLQADAAAFGYCSISDVARMHIIAFEPLQAKLQQGKLTDATIEKTVKEKV